MLPNNDMTEIGERGITISGGQKQRLNIARAIYFDADIVLMDDPLSAVDAHVGRHIFDNAILGLLKDKCRVLATHQLWVLSRCDRIIWMEGGKIQAIDTFDNLMKNSEGFQQLMETTAVEEKKDEAPTTAVVGAGGPAEKKKKKSKGGLMQQEERAVASVSWSVYASYVRASGSILNAPLVLGLLILSQGANIVTSLWLSWWTSNNFGYSMGTYIGVYAGLGATQAIMMFSFMVSLSIFGTTASKGMLRQAITRVLRAPMSFFDTTPLGRITNRFSRDVDVMDNNLTDAMRMYFFSVGSIIAVFALIIAFFYYFAIALVPLFVIFILATSYYRASAREVKRIESVLRSGMFAKFSEGLSGIACIRAYGLQDRFVADIRKAIDDMDSAYFLTYSNQRWLSVRLDMIGNCLVFTTGILVVTSRFSVNPSIGGLVLSYILSIVQMIQFTVRQLAEVENGMNSVERLQYYGTQLEEEAPLKTIEVRKTWPEKGEIIFDDVEMRYRAGLPLVLQGLSMHIRGGERIGIVGRTGAGKSSIMSTLFRLVELSGGHITIDGIDISTIGLQDLRSRLAIIPQDPTLFRGTVRSNLDPFGEHNDLELWSALRQAGLVSADAGPTTAEQAADGSNSKDTGRIHLDSVVEEDGLNFSLGQRQLMALARALVRGAQIIVCDEATSSVDMETDDKIQATIATGFRGKTLLCIAHRLRTIIGYDRICVMDKGKIAEMGPPLDLWKMEDGIFRGMCDRSGIRVEDIQGAKDELAGYDLDGAETDIGRGEGDEKKGE
jgi:ABC-type multidrug transport system fused ATPase/permease subunit